MEIRWLAGARGARRWARHFRWSRTRVPAFTYGIHMAPKAKILFLLFSSAAIISQAAAKDLRDQLNIQTGKAVLVIPGVEPQLAAEQVKDAITQFAIPTSLNFHPLPPHMPAVPDSPSEKQVIISGAPATDFVCDNSYAEITKTPPPVQNAFYFNREALRACLYAFQGGVKVEMIFHVMHKSESITGGLFNGIAKGIEALTANGSPGN